jgi:hypothetical protein
LSYCFAPISIAGSLEAAPRCFVLISMVSWHWSSRLALRPASNFVSSYKLFVFAAISITLRPRGLPCFWNGHQNREASKRFRVSPEMQALWNPCVKPRPKYAVQSNPKPIEASEKSESCPHALIAAERQGGYGSTYSLCCRFSSQQVVRVLPPLWALTRDFRTWSSVSATMRTFWNRKRLMMYTTRFVLWHVHSCMTDMPMHTNGTRKCASENHWLGGICASQKQFLRLSCRVLCLPVRVNADGFRPKIFRNTQWIYIIVQKVPDFFSKM